MKLIPISEADLTSSNDYRFAEAVGRCKSGDPEGCFRDLKACSLGTCFDLPCYESKTNRQLVELLESRDSVIRQAHETIALLKAELSRTMVDLNVQYGQKLGDGKLTIFSIHSMRKRLADSERRLHEIEDKFQKMSK